MSFQESTKILVVFFSRTGTTKEVAREISSHFGCELEELVDTKRRGGLIGWLVSGKDAIKKCLTEIEKPKHPIKNYQLIIVGTPVWVGTVSTPVRTYLEMLKDSPAALAFFTTSTTGKYETLFSEMEELCGKRALATLTLKTKEVKTKKHHEKVKKFVDELKSHFEEN